MTAHQSETRTGLLAALASYGIWGLLPIYFKLLHGPTELEVVSQRVLWSLLLLFGVLIVRHSLPTLFVTLRKPRLLLPLTLSSLLIGANWLTYIWAVNSGHVIAASLGYFFNPLVNVVLGVVVLQEKVTRGQAIAIAVAAMGAAVMAATALTTLWISILLAMTFAFYGLIRKMTPVGPVAGLATETLILAPLAIACLLWLSSQHRISFGQDAFVSGLMIFTGALTTTPLILFAVAAHRLPMATLGLMQYLSPTLQFLSGLLLFGETLTRGQMVSFALIWVGLLLFAGDSFASARRRRLASA